MLPWHRSQVVLGGTQKVRARQESLFELRLAVYGTPSGTAELSKASASAREQAVSANLLTGLNEMRRSTRGSCPCCAVLAAPQHLLKARRRRAGPAVAGCSCVFKSFVPVGENLLWLTPMEAASPARVTTRRGEKTEGQGR